MIIWVILVVAAAILLLGIVLYNRLVRTQQMASEGWSGIDVQLKRRSDLIPNLVTTVQGYATHERALFDEIARLRTEAGRIRDDDVAARAKAETQLSSAVGKLIALAAVRRYPSRIKCALLGWHALMHAITGQDGTASTETSHSGV